MSDSAKQTDQPTDSRGTYHSGPFPELVHEQPGRTAPMDPRPDHGEHSYEGHGILKGKAALITGGDSRIGKAVAIAFVREGADVAISYLPEEEEDAQDTAEWIRKAGKRVLLVSGDGTDEDFSTGIVDRTLAEFGPLDVLVLNAAYQKNRDSFESLPTEELGPKGIRVNAVAPGPIWTPLIPATEWPDKLPAFGQDTPLQRAGQPAELAPAYVLLASDNGSYISGAVLPVTGGNGL